MPIGAKIWGVGAGQDFGFWGASVPLAPT